VQWIANDGEHCPISLVGGQPVQTKDYLTLLLSLLSLLVATSSFFMSRRANARAGAAKNVTDVVEVASRKNEIVNEYNYVLILVGEYRFYTRRLSTMLAELGPGNDPEGHSMAKHLVRTNLDFMDLTEGTTKRSIAEVRALDSTEITTNPEARKKLQELHGRPQETRIKLTGMVEDLKRKLQDLSEKMGRTDPLSWA
jgi:hypothetical protein